MKNIIEVWRYNYFIQPLLDIVLIVTLILSIKKRNLFDELKLIPFYLSSFILLMFNTYIYYLFLENTRYASFFASIDRYGNYLVSLIEFLTFCYYFYSLARLLILRKAIKIATIICLLLFVIFFFKIINSTKIGGMIILNNLYKVESGFLMALSIIYLFDNLLSSTADNFRTPSIWIPAGLLAFLCLSMIPTITTSTFFLGNIAEYKEQFAFIYLGYILLFLALIKSYISSKP